jgi:hypothetical protein
MLIHRTVEVVVEKEDKEKLLELVEYSDRVINDLVMKKDNDKSYFDKKSLNLIPLKSEIVNL